MPVLDYRRPGAIWIDPWTGAIVHDRSSATMSGGDSHLTEQLWIDNGSSFGFPARLLVFGMGLLPLAFFITGFRDLAQEGQPRIFPLPRTSRSRVRALKGVAPHPLALEEANPRIRSSGAGMRAYLVLLGLGSFTL